MNTGVMRLLTAWRLYGEVLPPLDISPVNARAEALRVNVGDPVLSFRSLERAASGVTGVGCGQAPQDNVPVGPLLQSLRPGQWIKNLFVFAGVVFSQNLFTPLIVTTVAAFAVFCGLSGAIYLLNDVADAEKDRLHPQKRFRPIAAGLLSRRVALLAAIVLLVGMLTAAVLLSTAFGLVAATYVILMVSYSFRLKHVVIVDVLTVGMGFVLRATAGAVVIDVEISPWLLVCTTLLALLLAVGKRRHELLSLPANTERHRPILSQYSPALLDQMIAVVTASTITAYGLYTMSPATSARFHAPWLPITLLFVLYGILRYLYLIYHQHLGGNPTELVLRDRPLFLNTLLWVIAVVFVIYGPTWFSWLGSAGRVAIGRG